MEKTARHTVRNPRKRRGSSERGKKIGLGTELAELFAGKVPKEFKIRRIRGRIRPAKLK
jgi:hypothetical protein